MMSIGWGCWKYQGLLLVDEDQWGWWRMVGNVEELWWGNGKKWCRKYGDLWWMVENDGKCLRMVEMVENGGESWGVVWNGILLW